MKNKITNSIIIPIFLLCAFSLFAQVEVRSTSPNSVLDINSTNKAVLLPRIDNTSLVISPEEGLFVYNKASKTPSYHDGTQWNNVGAMMMPTSDKDSLTYTVLVGYNPPGSPDLVTGTYELSSFNISTPEPFPGPFYFDISKSNDINTTGFLRLFADNSSNSVQIEINVYKAGVSTPYFSYKYTDLKIESASMSTVKGGLGQIEGYTISAQISGFKDHVNNISIAIDENGNQVSY